LLCGAAALVDAVRITLGCGIGRLLTYRNSGQVYLNGETTAPKQHGAKTTGSQIEIGTDNLRAELADAPHVGNPFLL